MHFNRVRVAALCTLVTVVGVIGTSRVMPTAFALTNGGSITSLDAPLTENFDSLASAGTNIVWTDNTTIPGWYATRTTYNSGTGSSNAGALYSFGVAGTNPASDRALGSIGSGSTGTIFFAARFVNNTGQTITSLDVSYTGEQWRNGGNASQAAQSLTFQYQAANAGVITGANAPTTGWTTVSNLNFTSPITTPTAGALDGNAPANRTPKSSTIAVTVNPGQEVWLRWQDIDDTGNDHGLAIDDVSVTAHGAVLTVPPSGVGSAAPASVDPGAQSQLTVTVTPGTNAVSSVTADLSAIGGSASQAFAQSGNVYSFLATIGAGTSGGLKTLPVTMTDSIGTTGSTSIQLTVTAPTPPSGTGSANPAAVAPGATTTLTVNVTAGQHPPSTGTAVTGDLTAIGGSASQAFTDNGSGSFGYLATVAAGTSDGSKTLAITIADEQHRTGALNIAVNVATPFVAPNVKISQVYGGGGNSGATYLNDFVELFNAGTSPVDVTNWSVQEASATSTTWNVAALCQTTSCVIPPGHYFLVWESAGTGTAVQVPLPAADAVGTATVSATSAKFALMANATPLTGSCATGQVVDFVGYGTANCSETQAAPVLANTTADVRLGNGCTDTDNNSADFIAVTPVPRNSASPTHLCGDPSQLRALGLASPTGPERGGLVTLTVTIQPPLGAPAADYSVVGDLSSIGASPSQPFFDDGTNGDASAGDNTFTYQTRVPLTTTKGIHGVTAVVTDGHGTSLTEPMTFTAALPTCGTERWSVKVGDDTGASLVDLTSPATPTTIQALRAVNPPTLFPNPPYDPRFTDPAFGGVETTRWVLNATMMAFKKETDVDYHIVIADTSGTMIAEIPEPDCASDGSPFRPGILTSRQTFDGHLTATPDFQSVALPVRLTGVGFFDFLHGQTGVAPNGIELHPVLDIVFQGATTTSVVSNANPSKYLDDVSFTAAVSSQGAASPTGDVTFYDGGTPIGSATLDQAGHATVHTASLAVGTHSIVAMYAGDENSTPGSSAPLTQTVGKADQTISFDSIPDKTFGDPDFAVTASSTSGLGVTLAVASGPATLSSNTVHITAAGVVTISATQAGDGSFGAAAEVDRSFTVAKASQTITFNGAVPTPLYGALPLTVTASGGASGNPVTFTGNGACTVQGQNGIATVTIVSAGDCHVIASQTGSGNYKAAPDATETITVGRATADIHVKSVTAVYDGQPHALKGTAVGVATEDLSALLNLGAAFTNVPGGTATWSFAGNGNYLPASGQETVTITKATPAFAGLSAVSIEAGSATTTLGGIVSLGALIPTGAVAITFNGVTTPAAVGPDGRFAAVFQTASLAASSSPYGVTFAYGGDGNFNAIGGTGSVRVVDTTAPAISGVAASLSVLGPPNHKMVDVLLAYQATDLGADGRTVVSQPSCTLSVASNEPVNGTGDGNTSTDWLIVDAHHVQLRAERAGTGSGRVYTITIGCSDAAGNRSSANVTVTVPK